MARPTWLGSVESLFVSITPEDMAQDIAFWSEVEMLAFDADPSAPEMNEVFALASEAPCYCTYVSGCWSCYARAVIADMCDGVYSYLGG